MILQCTAQVVSLEVEKSWIREQNFLTFLQTQDFFFFFIFFFHPFKYPKHAKEAVHILKADKCCNWRAGAQREQEAKLAAK